MSTLLATARRYHAAGLPLLPNDATAKYPATFTGWERKVFDLATLEDHVGQGGALGLRMGDGREAIDLDAKNWLGPDSDELRRQYEGLVENNAPGLLARLVIAQTRSGGRHYLYRCAQVGRNQKLALRPATDDELSLDPRKKAVALIETRGEGGQVQIAPSPGYSLIQGDYAALPEITPEERQVLISCARALNCYAPRSAERPSSHADGPRPGDHYNQNGGVDEALDLLLADGWAVAAQRGATTYLTRPGGTPHTIHASYGHIAPGVFWSWSTSCAPFEPETAYSPFAVRAVLQHGGDFKACARELAQRYNLGRTAAATATATAPPPNSLAAVPTGSSGITIDITDENLGQATAEIWSAMLASSYAPHLYRYGSEIALLDGGLTTLDEVHWRGMVNRAASFVKTKTGKGGAIFTKEVIPPLAMITDSLRFVPDSLPVIERVSPLPIFDDHGRLLTAGYHAESRTLVTSDITPAELEPGDALRLILDELLVDFPFASQADRANAVAYLLLPFIRELCGAMPLFLIDAAQRGTGKTLLNDLVHVIWTGEPAPLSDLPLNAEEQRKALTTHLLGAPVSVVFDDISLLAGHALQRAVTGQVWMDRLLGANKEVSVPIRAVWAATGNNVTLGGDMVRRTVLIRLESDLEHPSQRTGFRRSESDLRAWVREHRAQLVSACTSLVAYGLAHGQPGGVVLGGFDQFARVVSRILDGIGVPGFCENLTSVLAREDGRQSGWRLVIRTWWDTHGTRRLKASEILKLIEADDDNEIIIDGDTLRARASSAGRLVKAKAGAIFAFEDVRLRLEQTRDGKGDTCYQLREIVIPHQEGLAEHSEHSGHSLAPTDQTRAPARTEASGAAMSAMFAMFREGIEMPKKPTAAELMARRMAEEARRQSTT